MRGNLRLVQDPDRTFIDSLVIEHRADFASDMSSPSLTVDDLNSGPWYEGGELGYIFDDESARSITDRIWGEEDLSVHLREWTSDYERYVVSKSISAATFSGIRWGRTVAGSIIDAELAGGAEAMKDV